MLNERRLTDRAEACPKTYTGKLAKTVAIFTVTQGPQVLRDWDKIVWAVLEAQHRV